MPVIDTMVYEGVAGVVDTGDCIHISGDVYAVVYGQQGPGPGWIRTFTVSADGSIGAIIDSWQFDAIGFRPKIIRRAGNVYIIVYQTQAVTWVGRIITTVINDDGTLGGAVIDFLDFGNPPGPAPAPTATFVTIFPVSGDTHAMTYRDEDSDLWLVTVSVTAAGAIGAGIINQWEFEPVWGQISKVIQVSPGIFAVAYHRTFLRGTIVTVPINVAGVIGAQIDNYEFCASVDPRIAFFTVAGTVRALAFVDRTGATPIGAVMTIDIDNAGNIAPGPIQIANFGTLFDNLDSPYGAFANNRLAVAYRGWQGANVSLATTLVSITDAGIIDVLIPEGWVVQTGTFDELPLSVLNIAGDIDLVSFVVSPIGRVVTLRISIPVVQTLQATGVT